MKYVIKENIVKFVESYLVSTSALTNFIVTHKSHFHFMIKEDPTSIAKGCVAFNDFLSYNQIGV